MQVELEQRIEALEYEMHTLKHELQRMLLEIQEQVLVHYYPNLVSVDRSHSKRISQAIGERRKNAESSRASRHPASNKTSPATPKTAQTTSLAPTQEPPAHRTRQKSVHGLAEWVSDTVTKMGSTRTSKLIEAYARKNALSPEIKETLLQFTPPDDGEDTTKPVTVNVFLMALLQLDKQLGKGADIETALQIVEEAELG